MITAARPDKKGVSIKLEPRLLGCRHLSVRRGNPTFEASGQRAVTWKHQSGSGLAEIGWLNNCEHHGSVTFNRLKMLISLNQKVCGQVRHAKLSATVASSSRRTRKMQPHRSQLLTGQQGKPYSPRREAVSRPQGMGMAERVKERGKSEGRSVIDRTGPLRWRYPTRKGADFRMWSQRKRNRGAELIAGEVRR